MRTVFTVLIDLALTIAGLFCIAFGFALAGPIGAPWMALLAAGFGVFLIRCCSPIGGRP